MLCGVPAQIYAKNKAFLAGLAEAAEASIWPRPQEEFM